MTGAQLVTKEPLFCTLANNFKEPVSEIRAGTSLFGVFIQNKYMNQVLVSERSEAFSFAITTIVTIYDTNINRNIKS